MNLHERPTDPLESVAQGNAGMGQASGIDDRPVKVALVESVDECAFVVRLKGVDLESKLGAALPESLFDLREGGVAVDLRFARAQQIQVGAVEDEDASHRTSVSNGASGASRSSPDAVGVRPRAAARPASTASSGTSERTTTPVSVGRTQLRRPWACFLSVAMCSQTASRVTAGGSTARSRRWSRASMRSAR